MFTELSWSSITWKQREIKPYLTKLKLNFNEENESVFTVGTGPGPTIHHDSGHTWAHDSNYAVSGIIKLIEKITSKILIKSGQVDRNQHNKFPSLIFFIYPDILNYLLLCIRIFFK